MYTALHVYHIQKTKENRKQKRHARLFKSTRCLLTDSRWYKAINQAKPPIIAGQSYQTFTRSDKYSTIKKIYPAKRSIMSLPRFERLESHRGGIEWRWPHLPPWCPEIQLAKAGWWPHNHGRSSGTGSILNVSLLYLVASTRRIHTPAP
jgi:hypothetical protein